MHAIQKPINGLTPQKIADALVKILPETSWKKNPVLPASEVLFDNWQSPEKGSVASTH